MNLNFIAEHTADRESINSSPKIEEFRKQTFQFAIHVKKIGRGDWIVGVPSKQKESFLENQGIKEQYFITLVFKWSLLGLHSPLIKSYIDASMGRQKHGKTANDCFDNILLHLCQWYALE